MYRRGKGGPWQASAGKGGWWCCSSCGWWWSKNKQSCTWCKPTWGWDKPIKQDKGVDADSATPKDKEMDALGQLRVAKSVAHSKGMGFAEKDLEAIINREKANIWTIMSPESRVQSAMHRAEQHETDLRTANEELANRENQQVEIKEQVEEQQSKVSELCEELKQCKGELDEAKKEAEVSSFGAILQAGTEFPTDGLYKRVMESATPQDAVQRISAQITQLQEVVQRIIIDQQRVEAEQAAAGVQPAPAPAADVAMADSAPGSQPAQAPGAPAASSAAQPTGGGGAKRGSDEVEHDHEVAGGSSPHEGSEIYQLANRLLAERVNPEWGEP